MCGILGQINNKGAIDKSTFIKMLDTMVHRGPDGHGTYFSQDNKIALGHRRLALIDLSDKATQPLYNEDKTIWLTVNGEIYNYPVLRKTLQQKGHTFSSNSDSEIIIHGYEEWGFDIVSKLKGMFAFGLLDEKKQLLFLARDRFGIKPLYYFQSNDDFIFSSEIKGIVENPDVPRNIDFSSFSDFFTYRYIPSPKTIWKNIFKIPPANYLIYNFNGNASIHEYWKLESDNKSIPEKEAIEKVDYLLEKSIKGHILSDLPVGSFLSGGYDSSALVYYMHRIHYPTSTFSIGFENWEKSEHNYADIVAKQFKTNLFSKIIGQSELGLLDKLAYHYDEPIADISIIPTYLVSELAKKHVKAVLSGEGADEIFSGYTWHKTSIYEMNFWAKMYHFKNLFSHGKQKFSINEYSNAMAMGLFGKEEINGLMHRDLHNNIPVDPFWFYRQHFKPELSPVKRFQFMDIKTFMGELVLTKVDRASMANSLEVRVPFLDHELVEFLFSLSENSYIRKRVQKFLLFENIKKDLPKVILERKKQGFVGPDSYYENMQWYQNVLNDSKLVSDQIVNKHFIDHLLEVKDHWRLWKIVVMEKWYSKWV